MPIDLAYRDDVAIVTINRPEALNALSFALIRDIGARLEEVAQSRARAMLFVGAGPKAFCAGADIKELLGRDLQAHRRDTERGQATFARIAALPMPSIAVIHGFAFGGGLELALACSFRLGTKAAKVGLPEIKLGLVPGYGGTQRLPRVVGEARALEMILTGRTVEAEEAHRIGLLNRIVEGDPVEAGIAFAREFTGYGMIALAHCRAAVERALDVPVHEGLKIEADLSTVVFQSADSVEGMTAFAEKRRAQFRDA
ncbi:MAG: enoyl-CoA hydratase/isomerase family protein [Alphaproteobacteria bacterium]|nr:enoyl-CoA hydratase/isomerase family protein [Alphaproteobacteria bacterium]